VAFRNGGSPPQRVDAAGAQGKGISGFPSHSRKNRTTQAHSVTAGRVIGTVEMVDGVFTTITAEGVVVGEFASGSASGVIGAVLDRIAAQEGDPP
jgi:hypothetical protein